MTFYRKNYKWIWGLAGIALLCILLIPPALSEPEAENGSIAVLPGLSRDDAMTDEVLEKAGSYKVLVIDAWDYTKMDIEKLKKQGCRVYSYLNVGSLETWRPWYKDFESLCLLPYEGWPDESWVNVTDLSWQDHCIKTASFYLKKGIDGFFLDNVDVCQELEENSTFEKGQAEDSITAIVTGIRSLKDGPIPVILNGGTSYLDYEFSRGNINPCSGICLESVYTEAVNYETDESVPAAESDIREKTTKLKAYQEKGLTIWDIEYTKNRLLAQSIRRKTARNGWSLYVASSYALDRPE